jgi:hypothetical protein
MVYAVIAEMAFQNASRRDNAKNFVDNRLTVENMWGPVISIAATNKAGQPTLTCNFRFLDAIARDTFYTDLQAQLQGAQGPVVGSWISKHDCTHDEPVPVPCAESNRVTF